MKMLRTISRSLTESLGLTIKPVALAISDTIPPGVSNFKGNVPAGCVFWQEASSQVFVTAAEHHSLCSIGTHTHNFSGASASDAELADTLKAMAGLDYVRKDEVAGIPVMNRKVKYVVYGPLEAFPVAPDVIFIFADARQGLVLTEATTRIDGESPAAMGRPACAVVPKVVNEGTAVVSLGCCGARAYMDAMSDDISLWALPGKAIEGYCAEVDTLSRANRALARFHQRRREDIATGARPTVRESLERM